MAKAKYILDDNDKIKSEFLTKDNSDNLIDGLNNSGTSQKLLSELSEYQKSGFAFESVKDALDYLLYTPIVITSFQISSDNSLWGNSIIAEVGDTVADVYVQWATSFTPSNISLTDASPAIHDSNEFFMGVNLTSNKTYTLTVSDAFNNVSSNTSVQFRYAMYYGVNTKESLNIAEGILEDISALINDDGFTKDLVNNPTGEYTFDCSGGKYIYFILHNNWNSDIKFIVSGIEVNFIQEVTEFINEAGATYQGKIFRSPELLYGSDVVITIE